ncbi:hypothetical protein HK098_003875 [Nowakowskiella sp. JEL0407]|nr:hypothetical protein HK098_003875 [Nowakowskiella sp. JEL0407]
MSEGHLLSLKVLRLSKPSFPLIPPITFLEKENSIANSSAENVENFEIPASWRQRLADDLTSSLPHPVASSASTNVMIPPLPLLPDPLFPTSNSDHFNESLLRSFTIPNLLSLPSSFGNIYLGELFSSFICVNNESSIPVLDVGVKCELQTATQRFTLCDTLAIVPPGNNNISTTSSSSSSVSSTTNGNVTSPVSPRSGSGRVSLLPSQSQEFLVSHDLKELGIHVLVCSIHYTPSRTVPINNAANANSTTTNNTIATAPDRKFFRKFFKFQVLNPISVKTKINSVKGENVVLEVQICNLSGTDMCLERMKFDSDGWDVRELNENFFEGDNGFAKKTKAKKDSKKDGIYVEDIDCEKKDLVVDGEESENSQNSTKKDGIFGKYTYLKPNDLRQYLYYLTPAMVSSPPLTNLGKLDILWRTQFGLPGRLQTSQLSHKQVTVDPYTVSVLSIPPKITAEDPFSLKCQVENNFSEIIKIVVVGVKNKMSSVLLVGDGDLSVGEVGVSERKEFELKFFPLATGVHKITGIKVLELKSGGVKEIDCLADVFVE